MHSDRLLFARHALAFFALLATLSGAVAPMCASMTTASVAAEHCSATKGHEMPSPAAPHGSPEHRGPIVCTMAICVAIPLSPAAPVLGRVPAIAPVPSVEVALISAVPQHTTPPPRS